MRWSPSTQLPSAVDPALTQAPCVTHLVFPSLTLPVKQGTNSLSTLSNTWNRESTSYFRSTLNLIIPHSFFCIWQLSQPQIRALSAQTICSCTAIFNWHFPAKPQRFASGFFHMRAATNKAARWPTLLPREGIRSLASVTKQKRKRKSKRFWLKGSEQMSPRLIVCTWAPLCVFTPCRNLATQGEISHTKQVAFMQYELGLIRDFLLARMSCKPCDIPTGLLLWPGVTASRVAGDSSFALAKTSRKVPISVNWDVLCFVTGVWAELPPANWTRATGKSFPPFLTWARFNEVA